MNSSQVVSFESGLPVNSLRGNERYGPGVHRADLFDFVAMLQTTLDRQCLLDIFVTRLQRALPVIGVRFEFDAGLFDAHLDDYRHGELEGERCAARLHAGEQFLGTLEVHSRSPLAHAQREQLDRLLACLVHPLRNCLMYAAVTHKAHTDPLTGVSNRAAYEKAVEREVARGERSGGAFSLLVIDLNKFKALNDRYGHLVGDKALQDLTACLNSALRETDQLFRLGGDEFVVILPQADAASANEVASRLSSAVSQQCTQPALSISVGFAQWQPGMGAGKLFAQADHMLYERKRVA